MLVPAKLHVDELNKLIGGTIIKPEYKWWHSSYASTSITVDDNLWSNLQFVKINNAGGIAGYYNASLLRPENYIDSVSCINFDLENKISFAIGLKQFLNYLVNVLNVPKIKWTVFIGNPIEKTYDKICEKYGGKIIGVENYAVLINNKMYDRKAYQWFNKGKLPYA